MQFELRIVGDQLYRTLMESADDLAEAMLQLCRHTEPVLPKLIRLADRPRLSELLLQSDLTKITLLEAQDLSLIDAIQAMERKELAFLNSASNTLPKLAPIIAIFDSPDLLADIRDFPELISDWAFMPLDPSELARRIFSVLKRRNILKTKIRYGVLSLLAETRMLVFFGNAIQLTRSEFALAELFLSQMGTVIPLADLAMLFRSTGKSTEGSNIRVTVFQLRLKLEMLTKSQYTVMSVYKQGYCLKQKTRSTIKEISDGLDARQRGNARFVS